MFRASLCPSSGEQECALPHMVEEGHCFFHGTVFVLIVEGVEGRIEKTVTLLKPLKHPSLLIPYAHFFIQSFHKAGNLISQQYPGEPNPLLQMAINPSHPPT